MSNLSERENFFVLFLNLTLGLILNNNSKGEQRQGRKGRRRQGD